MTGFSDGERYVLNGFQEGNSPLKAVLAKFCELKSEEYRRSCTQRMSIVPSAQPTMRRKRMYTSRSCAN